MQKSGKKFGNHRLYRRNEDRGFTISRTDRYPGDGPMKNRSDAKISANRSKPEGIPPVQRKGMEPRGSEKGRAG